MFGVEGDSEKNDDEMIEGAKHAGISDFVSSLPQGYDTEVGSHGLALSGGQKQRLSLARALVRNPSLLLLDEATSSLDGETERHVQEMLNETKGTRTMVVVAHRLATVQNADVIFVMSDGEVIEQGDHAELISRKGAYYRMVSSLFAELLACGYAILTAVQCQSQALDR